MCRHVYATGLQREMIVRLMRELHVNAATELGDSSRRAHTGQPQQPMELWGLGSNRTVVPDRPNADDFARHIDETLLDDVPQYSVASPRPGLLALLPAAADLAQTDSLALMRAALPPIAGIRTGMRTAAATAIRQRSVALGLGPGTVDFVFVNEADGQVVLAGSMVFHGMFDGVTWNVRWNVQWNVRWNAQWNVRWNAQWNVRWKNRCQSRWPSTEGRQRCSISATHYRGLLAPSSVLLLSW